MQPVTHQYEGCTLHSVRVNEGRGVNHTDALVKLKIENILSVVWKLFSLVVCRNNWGNKFGFYLRSG